jgi:hypothetical protein
MAKVYALNDDGRTEAMNKIHCVNEDLELQRILELNPDLIPGDQIRPEDPRHWLIIKREMPVPDPSTGGNRWSIDLFFTDQDAMPTFIECKRYEDTRARREVIGQMLEYAANGHYYWEKDEIRAFAEQHAANNGLDIDDEIRRLQPEQQQSTDDYFQRIQDNLREGIVRLVFFMEEAPQELKSLVDFLNRQMERSEVLLVEGRQYEYKGMKIISPVLFGYTEEARRIKRAVTVTSTQKRQWDKDSFFNDARERLSDYELTAVKRLFDKSQQLNCEITWGTGKTTGSFSAKWPHLGKTPVYAVYSDGTIMINYGSFNKTADQQQFSAFLKASLEDKAGLTAPDDYEKRYPNYKVNVWSEKIDGICEVLDLIQEKYSANDNQ